MLPESFGGRIIYLLQQYGPSFAEGSRSQHVAGAGGNAFWMHHWFSGWYRADDPG